MTDQDEKTPPLHVLVEEHLVEEQYLPEWRKHRQREIDEAIAIIKPEPGQREACRTDVERRGMCDALAIAVLCGKDRLKTKKGKAAVARLTKTLRRLEAVLKDEDLDQAFAWSVTRDLSLQQVQEIIKSCDGVKATASGKLVQKDAEAKRRAVKLAHELLTKYNEPEARVAIGGTNRSAFCRLAALFYGDRDEDLYLQCLPLARASRKKWGSK